MNVTLFMAISLNGFVADESGSEEFISHANWDIFCGLAREKGSLIIGRKTFEAVKNWGADYSFDDLKDIPRVVLTTGSSDVGPEYILASSPQEALEKLSGLGIRSTLIGGGPTVNSSFMKAGLVDEIIFNIEPVVVGKGKAVFAPDDFEAQLQFDSVKELSDGIVQVHYKVKK